MATVSQQRRERFGGAPPDHVELYHGRWRGKRAVHEIVAGDVSIATLADAVSEFLNDHNLTGIDVVGSSMGARLVLELARRGVVGATVLLDPGGFWRGWERPFFMVSITLSIRLIRLLKSVRPLLTGNPVTRTLLFAQFSAHP